MREFREIKLYHWFVYGGCFYKKCDKYAAQLMTLKDGVFVSCGFVSFAPDAPVVAIRLLIK